MVLKALPARPMQDAIIINDKTLQTALQNLVGIPSRNWRYVLLETSGTS